MIDTNPCRLCGGEGQLICRESAFSKVPEVYTIECEDCNNFTESEYPTEEEAIKAWNKENEN